MSEIRRRLQSHEYEELELQSLASPTSPPRIHMNLTRTPPTSPANRKKTSILVPSLESPNKSSFSVRSSINHQPPSYNHNQHNYRTITITLTRRRMIFCTLLLLLILHVQISVLDYSFQSHGMNYVDPTTGVSKLISPPSDLLTSLPNKVYDEGRITISESNSFSVVINTYKRPDMLALAVDHYARTCGRSAGISNVYVVWAELDVEPPSMEELLFHAKVRGLRADEAIRRNRNWSPVEFVRVEKDSLNSRFLPIEGLEDEAIFMVDDDVQVECSSLVTGFEAWRYNSNALVGYYPRLASPPLGKTHSTSEELVYHTWPLVYARNMYTYILTKACFMHQKYMSMYHDPEVNPKEILDYVDEDFNCEDIAMAFLVAKETYKKDRYKHGYCADCPVYVEGSITDLGLLNGISTSGGSLKIAGHMKKRSQCLTKMKQIYKKHGYDYPLFDVSLQDQSWLHHYPKFLRLIKPSNFFEWGSFGNTFS